MAATKKTDELTRTQLAAWTIKYQAWLKTDVTRAVLETAMEAAANNRNIFELDIDKNREHHYYSRVYERIADGDLYRATLSRAKRLIRESAEADTITDKLHSEAVAGKNSGHDAARVPAGLPGLPHNHPANSDTG